MAIASSITACTVSTPTATNTTTTATTTSATTPVKTESLPLVVATNSVACALTKQIAGDTIDLKCLIEAGTDPHVYQPKPDDRKAIDSAKLILYGGYDFEPSLIKLIQASSNTAPKIAVNEVAVPSPLLSEDGHSHDHDKEEKKETKSNQKAAKEADPHVWNNAQNGIKITQSISKSLISLRPDQAETYAKNTAKIVSELEQIDIWIKAQIATIPEASRKLVTTHLSPRPSHTRIPYKTSRFLQSRKPHQTKLQTNRSHLFQNISEATKDRSLVPDHLSTLNHNASQDHSSSQAQNLSLARHYS